MDYNLLPIRRVFERDRAATYLAALRPPVIE